MKRFFIWYSTDNFQTSSVVACTVNGAEITVEIPAQPDGTEQCFICFRAPLLTPQADYDLITLRFLNNEGENYSYTVQDEAIEVSLR
ncbi:MAG: hypothetical protein R2850_10600 [Bacteroidia bacterium]